jgi:pimeloyl-ACP methyl ester carboxylesterase
MDYNRALTVSGAKDYPKVHVALLMVPGRNHTNTGKYSKSPLLLNPGGPGGSGVSLAGSAGFLIQEIVGLDQDIIGFDPRGIGETTPLVDCWAFPENARPKDHGNVSQDDISRGWVHRLAWLFTGWEVPMVNSTEESLEKLDRRARLVADLCQTKDGLYGEDSILRHVSTPAVARDMLSIIDAWDAWREEEEKTGSDQNLAMGQSPEWFEEDPNLDTKGKLVYWGFSYGTLLGATFAAMFPDRVGRVILDGVVDADFYVSPVWTGSLLDTDAVEASFFKYCHEAGTRCAIYREGDSEADIRARVYDIAHKLKNNPVHGINAQTHTPTILTYEILKFIMFTSLYFPSMAFPSTALLLDLFYREDVAALMSVFMMPTSYDFRPYCAGYIPPQYQAEDVQKAIMCSDKRYPVSVFFFSAIFSIVFHIIIF